MVSAPSLEDIVDLDRLCESHTLRPLAVSFLTQILHRLDNKPKNEFRRISTYVEYQVSTPLLKDARLKAESIRYK